MRHDLKRAKLAVAHTCILCSCVMGTLIVFLFGAGIITMLSIARLGYLEIKCSRY